MNDRADPASGLYSSQIGGPIEPGEEIVCEERLRGPGNAPARSPLKADPGQENFEVQILPQTGRRNVLMFGLGLDAEPPFRVRQIR